MGHNIERAQALQEDLSQRRASLQHHSAEAQALQGQEALLADIIEEEMAHRTQVSVLSRLHLQQAEEIKSQSEEIRHLSTLLEKQAILERVQEQQSRVPEVPVPLVDRLQELQREAFNILPGTVNSKRGAAAAHASGISQDIPVVGRTQFEDELAEEAIWNVHQHPCHVHFASDPQGRFTSTPIRHPEEDRSKARISPEVYPPGYGMKVAVQEFRKLCEPKINKLKGGYSATANLIFQLWLKDINAQVEDRNLTEREAIQLVKDFTAERARDEVEFYMGMTVDEQQSFDGLVNHLKNAFQSGETISELISDFYGCHQKKNESEDAFADDLQILVRKITAQKPSFRAEANEQLKNQYAHKLHNQYYAAIARSVLQTSDPLETFTQFRGRLALTFSSRSWLGKVCSQTAVIETTASIISEVAQEPKLSRNSRQRQHKIDQQATKISSLEAQNQKLAQLLEPKFLVETITKAVASNLNINMDKKPQNEQTSGFTGKPYLGKPRPSKLAPGINGSLDPELSCRYCKDTGHLKENCIKLDQSKGEIVSGPHGYEENSLIVQLRNTSILAETKMEIMQRAVAKCPKVCISAHRIQIPSLLDSGSEVTLLQQSHFEQHILPKIKPATGEKADAHCLFKLTVANDGHMPIKMYTELDLTFLGLKVPKVGVLIAEEPNQVLDKKHQTRLPGIIGWNLIQLSYDVFIKKYGTTGFDSFTCPEGVNPLLFSQLCIYHHSDIRKNNTLGATSEVMSQNIEISKSPKTDDLSKKKTNHILRGGMEPLDRSQLALNKTLFVFPAIQFLLCQDKPIGFH